MERSGCSLGKKKRNRVYGLWKKGQDTQEDYKVVKLCKEKIIKAKPQVKVNLASAGKENRKHFHKYQQKED